MKSPLLALVLAVALASPAFAALAPGAHAPEFKATATMAGNAQSCMNTARRRPAFAACSFHTGNNSMAFK